MPPLPLTPEAAERLRDYLAFQRTLGVDRVAVAPDVLRPPMATKPTFAPAQRLAPAPTPPLPPAPSPATTSGPESLAIIQADLGPDCRRCKLHTGRHAVVFGDGNPHADLVFVGEGPGADEDEQGLPFVGRAGQLLTDMIQKGMGLQRSDVYICNVVKCRPPGNRVPEPDEVAACTPFLKRQLLSIRPRMICALGATAAQHLRPYAGSLGSVRGRIHPLRLDEFETRLVITYHPAYLLRDPSQKKEAWKDLQLIMEYLGLSRPGGETPTRGSNGG